MLHQLKAMREEVPYAIFLDLHKAYGDLDREYMPGYTGGVWNGTLGLPQPSRI